MDQIKDLLVDELQDLLHAESQLVEALPKMVSAAHNQKLAEGLQKHLIQTEGHVERLKQAFELLGEKAHAKPCKGMKGLIEEGQETIEELQGEEELGADLGLIAAAQRVEHYEIAGYGNARCLARQIGERQVAKLLSATLGEEERADFLLSEVAKPILQQATTEDNSGAGMEEGSQQRSKSRAQKASA